MPADAGRGPAGSRWRRRQRGGTRGTGAAPHGQAASGKAEGNAPLSLPAAQEEAGHGEGKAGRERPGW